MSQRLQNVRKYVHQFLSTRNLAATTKLSRPSPSASASASQSRTSGPSTVPSTFSSTHTHTHTNPSPSMQTGFEQLVGWTPIIRLNAVSDLAGCNVYGKCEFLNPAGSLKDRTAMALIKDFEENNQLIRNKPGIIVEGTTGNTGTALSVISSMYGYTPLIIVPKTMIKVKKDRLKFYGAQLIEVPNVEATHLNHFHSFAKRLSAVMKERLDKDGIKVVYSNQHDNCANYKIHYNTTGPEIYKQMNGNITMFSSSMGTGGSLSGIAKYLIEENKNIKICLTDPIGGYAVNWFNGKGLTKNGNTICEGTPGTRAMVSKNVINENDQLNPDYAVEIMDNEMINMIEFLKKEEGLAMGLSTGVNIAGVIKACNKFRLGKNDNVVTMLCDTSDNYIPKIIDYYDKINGNKLNGVNGNNNGNINGNKSEDIDIMKKMGLPDVVDKEVIHPFGKGSKVTECIEKVFFEGL